MTPAERLHALLTVVAADLLFLCVTLAGKPFEAWVRRRTEAYTRAARDGRATEHPLVDVEAWQLAMVQTCAPFATPSFVPMRLAIQDGLSMQREATGLRALLPIGVEAERERARRDGLLAVRALRAVAASDGELAAHELRALAHVMAAMGLPEADQRALAAETPTLVEQLELPATLEQPLARAIVHGAWEVAAADGLDEREHAALLALAARLRIEGKALDETIAEVQRSLAAQHAFALALIDILRYVTAPLPTKALQPWLRTAVRLCAPAEQEAALQREAAGEGPTPLTRVFDLTRAEKASVLSATWSVILAQDSMLSSRIAWAQRHDRAAAHLGVERAGAEARELVEEQALAVLQRHALAAGA